MKLDMNFWAAFIIGATAYPMIIKILQYILIFLYYLFMWIIACVKSRDIFLVNLFSDTYDHVEYGIRSQY